MSQDKTTFAIASYAYRRLFPHARIHHLEPSSRGGSDVEFNLFPWNEAAHRAWHQLFSILTVREVWPILADVHLQLFYGPSDTIVREWCLPAVAQRKKSERNDILTPRSVDTLRECWITCFGSSSLSNAEGLLRYMMLFMIFGQHADRSGAVYELAFLRSVIHDVRSDATREWAFRQCFQLTPTRAHSRQLQKMIRRIRSFAHTIPIH